MSYEEDNQPKSLEDIESIIEKAIEKVQGYKENDLCKYLPMSTGGYMHHFTLRKMKLKQPFELKALIEKFIVNPVRPVVISPKQRAARGSRKKGDQITFTKHQLERLLNIAKITGDQEIITFLSPQRSRAWNKQKLIQSIKKGVVDENLWNEYVESTKSLPKNSEEHEMQEFPAYKT